MYTDSTDFLPKIYNNLLLLEFCEKKIGKLNIINDEPCKIVNQYYRKEQKDIICIRSCFEKYYIDIIGDVDYDILEDVRDACPIVLECIVLCEGKLSICSNLYEIYNKDNALITLYFHSCTIDEAAVLLERCLKLVGEYRIYEDKIVSDSIIFRTNVYKDIHELLISKQHIMDRQLWDLTNGYITTLSTAIYMGISGYLFDINASTTHMQEYFYCGLDILFSGLNCEDISDIYPNSIITLPSCELSFGQEELIVIPHEKIFLERCLEHYQLKCYQQPKSTNHNVKQYLGPKYKTITIGIDNDRYVAFSNIKRAFNINSDIFNKLCEYWLVAEAIIAKESLLKE